MLQHFIIKEEKTIVSSRRHVVGSEPRNSASIPVQSANSIPHPSSSTILDNLSLPSDHVRDDRQELNKLQELRQCIQEDCDQFLLKKESLKAETASSPFCMNCKCSLMSEDKQMTYFVMQVHQNHLLLAL